MTLDEAIKHCEDVAAKCFVERSARNHSGKCGFEHLELAEWLKELKAYKEQEPCVDAISRKAAVVQLHHNKTGDDDIDVIIEKDIATIQTLPPVIPKQKSGEWIELKNQKPEAYEDVLVRDIDGDVTCAYLCDDVDFLERFSGEIIDDVVEWMEIPG